MECPGFERLVDYLERRLSKEESNSIEAHIYSGCVQCAESERWYRRVAEITAGDDSVEPPSWVLKRALRLFADERPERRFARRLKELAASLVFDSFARAAMAGARAAGSADRQLLYTADDYNIDLRISLVESSGASVIGQILKKSDERFESVSGLQLELILDGEEVFSGITSPSGEFAIQHVKRGDYDLRIETFDASITLYGLPAQGADAE